MWTERFVLDLAECKQARMPFAMAWAGAIQRHPPRLAELGVMRAHEDTLLDQSGHEALEWFRGVCRAAYEDAPASDGRPSRLRGVHAALRDGFPEREPVPTGRVRERPVAA